MTSHALFCEPLVDCSVSAAGVVVRLYDAMRDDAKWLAQFAELKSKEGSFRAVSSLSCLCFSQQRTRASR